VNKKFHEGTTVNPGSLDYAVNTQARSRNWLRTAAVFCRSIMIDHAFADGNKRTTLMVVIGIMELNKIDYDPERLLKAIQLIAKKNMHNTRQIERYLKDGIRIH